MVAIHVDRSTCAGHGNCVLAAPTFFDIDDHDLAVLLKEDVSEADVEEVKRAAYECPSESIVIEE
jgi:ferredoxin